MFLLFPFLLIGYLLIGLGVSIAIARWSGQRIRSRLVPWVAFSALFAVFFGDEIYGYWHWRHLCKTQGGLHVYKRVPVEGFLERGVIHEGIADEFLREGYSYIESGYYRDYGEKRRQLYRYTLNNKSLLRTPITRSLSRYIHTNNPDVPYFPYVWAREDYIQDRVTGKLISVERQFYYKGASVIRGLRAITGAEQSAAESCGRSAGNEILKAIPPIQAEGKSKHE